MCSFRGTYETAETERSELLLTRVEVSPGSDRSKAQQGGHPVLITQPMAL